MTSKQFSVKERLVRGGGASLAVNICGAGAALITQLILVRLMGRVEFGIYATALAALSVLVFFCRLGMDTALVRYVAVYADREDWGLLRGIMRKSNIAVSIAGALAGAALLFAGWVFGPAMRAGLAPTLQVAAFLLPVLALLGLACANLKGFKRAAMALLPESMLIPLVISVAAVAYRAASPSTLTAPRVMAMHFASALIVLAAAQLVLRREAPRVSRSAKRKYRTAEWIATARPLLFMSGMSILLQRTGTLLVGVFMGTTEAGNFSVAIRIATLISFGLAAVNAIAAPMIAEMYARHDKDELQRMLRHTALGIVAFTVPVCAGILALGKWLLEIFHPAYGMAYSALVCLSLGQTVSALTGPVGYLLVMTGHQVASARATGAVAALSMVLHLVLIPLYGLVGAGIASALALAVLNLWQGYIVRTRVGVNSSVFSLLRRGKT